MEMKGVRGVRGAAPVVAGSVTRRAISPSSQAPSGSVRLGGASSLARVGPASSLARVGRSSCCTRVRACAECAVPPCSAVAGAERRRSSAPTGFFVFPVSGTSWAA